MEKNQLRNYTKRDHKNPKSGRSLLFIGIAAIILCLPLPSPVLAGDNAQTQPNTNSFSLSYLPPEDMAISDYLEKQKGPEFYLDGLTSGDIYQQYISINKLIEYFNDEAMRQKAMAAITPYLDNQEEKLSTAASFALSILKKDYRDPNIYHLANGAVIFTLFNNYSDYGSYNQIWMIKDDQLTTLIDYSRPKMYITQIIPSPDKTRFAVVSCSNKSEYVTVYGMDNKYISPELVDSSRFKIAMDKGYAMWQREDFENYSGVESCHWVNNDQIEFNASLANNGTERVDSVIVTYNVKDKILNYKPEFPMQLYRGT